MRMRMTIRVPNFPNYPNFWDPGTQILMSWVLMWYVYFCLQQFSKFRDFIITFCDGPPNGHMEEYMGFAGYMFCDADVNLIIVTC